MPRLRTERTRRGQRRGTIVVLAAVCLIIVVAFLAFAVDFGYIVVAESELQNAADAGALSAARALQDGRKEARAAAKTWAAKNLASESTAVVKNEDIEIGQWDDDTATFTVLSENSWQSPNAVRVTCIKSASRGNQLNLFIASMLGTQSADLSATATARIETSRCGLIIGLPSVTMSGSSYTDSYHSANGPYSLAGAGNGGHVCSNGNITMSGSTNINGDAHPGPKQSVKSSGSADVLGDESPLKQSIAYPPADPGNAAWSNDNSSIPLSQNNKQPLNSSDEFTLSGGDFVDLPPGTYYFSKLTLSGGSTIRISGPTQIYVTGDVSLSGGSVANVTQLPKNLQLFPMGSKCVVSGSSEFYGIVYGPTTKVERSGASDYYGAIIAGQLVLSGSGGIHADQSLDLQMLSGTTQRAKLVE